VKVLSESANVLLFGLADRALTAFVFFLNFLGRILFALGGGWWDDFEVNIPPPHRTSRSKLTFGFFAVGVRARSHSPRSGISRRGPVRWRQRLGIFGWRQPVATAGYRTRRAPADQDADQICRALRRSRVMNPEERGTAGVDCESRPFPGSGCGAAPRLGTTGSTRAAPHMNGTGRSSSSSATASREAERPSRKRVAQRLGEEFAAGCKRPRLVSRCRSRRWSSPSLPTRRRRE
jgi:hypothetical protein